MEAHRTRQTTKRWAGRQRGRLVVGLGPAVDSASQLPIRGAIVSGTSPFAGSDLARVGPTHLVHESF